MSSRVKIKIELNWIEIEPLQTVEVKPKKRIKSECHFLQILNLDMTSRVTQSTRRINQLQ